MLIAIHGYAVINTSSKTRRAKVRENKNDFIAREAKTILFH